MAKPSIGQHVIYVDSHGQHRNALVTNVFGDDNPAINVAFVNDDDKQQDTYGRKLERATSVVHQSNQYAHGQYWLPV